MIANLTKDKNDKMHKMKIKDILSEQEISSKYKTYNKFENKIIIEKIYKEQKQIKVIKIIINKYIFYIIKNYFYIYNIYF